jgi:hypothetical protein
MALVSFFMCAKTDEEACARADGATFFQFALRYYGASQSRQRPARHRQHVGRVYKWEARESRSAGGGCAASDRLAGNASQKLRRFRSSHIDQVILLNQAARTATSTSAICSNCSRKK